MEVPYCVEHTQSGVGVFALQNISKGTLVRSMLPGVNTLPCNRQTMFQHLLVSLKSNDERIKWINRCYNLNGTIHEVLDATKYINHDNGDNVNIKRGQGMYNIRNILQTYNWYKYF